MAGRTRGPHVTPRALPNLPLSPEPPRGMKGRARALYVKLATDLATEGYACQADGRLVALAATTEAHAERLAAEVEKLAELTIESEKGGVRVHPLVTELRSVRRELASLYGQLFLSPRSRSSSRLSEEQRRQAVQRNHGKASGATRAGSFFDRLESAVEGGDFDAFLELRNQ